jgi:hypothetical protein
MRNVLLFLFSIPWLQAGAQLNVGDGSLTTYGGAAMQLDGMTLFPPDKFTVTNNRILQSTNPVPLTGSVTSINRVVTFSSPVAFTGTVRLSYDPAGLNGNAENDLKLSYRSAGGWRYSPGGVVNLTNYVVEEALTAKSFDGLTASAFYISLPVHLLSFTARWATGNTVLLQWQTAEEINNSHFSLERSGDGRLYAAIGTVQAAASGGQASYTFTDRQPLGGTNYYRLRQYDRDGRQRLYGVQMVKAGEDPGNVVLYPNPVTGDGFTVTLQRPITAPVAYTITNAGGQVVQTGRLASQWIATGKLPAGIYLLQLGDGQTMRFQKQ